MLRGLEVFWQIVTGISIIAATYYAIVGEFNLALITLLAGVMAGFRYMLRRRQRIKMSK